MSEAKEILNELKDAQLASLLISGLTVRAAAKQMQLSERQAFRLMETDEFKAVLRESADKLLSTAASTWKGAMSQRMTKALAVLDAKLDANDLEAVKLIVRTLGVEKVSEAPVQGNIQIVLPDYNKPKTIDIEVDNDSN